MAKRKFYVTKDQLEADYKNLRSTVKVAKKHGVSKRLVMNYMRQFGIPVIKRRTAKETDSLVRPHLEAGKSTAEIAKEVGVSVSVVHRASRRYGIPLNDHYHHGEIITHNGYRMIRAPDGHPAADSKGYVREHRLVMEKTIGRRLSPDEVVHHINHDKLDNRPENLKVMTLAEHTSSHHLGVPKPRRKR